MDSPTLVKIYGVVGAALFSFSFNLFWLERTGASIIKQIVPHSKTPSAILIGVVAIPLVSYFLLMIVDRHWRLHAAQPWFNKLPGAFVDPPDPRDTLAKAIKLFAYALFIVAPACIAVHFIDELWSMPVADRQGVFKDLTFHSMTSAIQAGGALRERFRIAEPDGVSFFPTIEPIGIIALVAVQCAWTLFQMGRLLRSMYRRK